MSNAIVLRRAGDRGRPLDLYERRRHPPAPMVALDPATGFVDPTWVPKPNKQVWSFATDGTNLAVGGVFTSVSKGTYRRVAVYRVDLRPRRSAISAPSTPWDTPDRAIRLDPRRDRQHAAGRHPARVARAGRPHLGQARGPEPDRFDEGSDRAGDGRSRGGRRSSSPRTRRSWSPPRATPGSRWRWWLAARATSSRS